MSTAPDIIDASMEDIDTALAELSLAEFIKQSWGVLHPEEEYLHNWHIDAIAEYLEAVNAGQIRRLVINMPPRALKSTCVTIAWPVWTWIGKPSTKFMITSYSADLSAEHSVNRRTLIESEWYQNRWGDRFELSSDQNAKNHFTNTHRGAMFATSMTGAGSGFGCDNLIVDDPHNPKKAESEADRKSANNAFRLQFSRRLNNKKKGAIAIVMQRLDAGDLAGIALEMGYTHLCLEGISPKRRFILLPSSLPPEHPITCDCSICTDAAREKAKKEKLPPPPEEAGPPVGAYIERQKGEYLHEAREGKREHIEARVELTSSGYAKQYDQRPSPEEGSKFKREWFQYFTDDGSYYTLHGRDGKRRRWLKELCRKFATADTAMTEEKTSDYTAVGIWAVTPENDLLLLEVIRERMEDPVVDRLLRGLILSGRVPYLAIETKGNGKTLFQRFVADGLTVRELKAEGDKMARATLASIDMENGKVFFLAEAHWLSDYELELIQFPNGGHDDQVDMTSYAAIEKGQTLSVTDPTDSPVSACDGDA